MGLIESRAPGRACSSSRQSTAEPRPQHPSRTRCPHAGYVSPAAPPRWVHVSSSGVTRPSRPGIDIEKEPPAVRMNDMLGGILDYKLKGAGRCVGDDP